MIPEKPTTHSKPHSHSEKKQEEDWVASTDFEPDGTGNEEDQAAQSDLKPPE